jgi:hypothetical protein
MWITELIRRLGGAVLSTVVKSNDGYVWPAGFLLDPGVLVLFPNMKYDPVNLIVLDRPVAVFADDDIPKEILYYSVNSVLRHYRAIVRELRDK